MKVLGYDPQITVQRAWQLSSSVEQALSLDDLFARSDAVTVHVPLNDQTRRLVNEPRLRLMKQGRRCSSTSRAPAIVDDAGRGGRARCRAPARLRLRLPDQRPQGPPEGRHPAAPRRLDRRGGGELRHHGGRPGARLPGERQHPQQRQLSRRRCCRACPARRASRSPTATSRTWSARSRPASPSAQHQHRGPAQQVTGRVRLHADRRRRRRSARICWAGSAPSRACSRRGSSDARLPWPPGKTSRRRGASTTPAAAQRREARGGPRTHRRGRRADSPPDQRARAGSRSRSASPRAATATPSTSTVRSARRRCCAGRASATTGRCATRRSCACSARSCRPAWRSRSRSRSRSSVPRAPSPRPRC